MIFRKKMPRSCSYCQNGTRLNDDQVLCIKRGVVPVEKACRKFIYDPCKRIPPKAKAQNFREFDSTDFSL